MVLLLLEALGAGLILVGIVWWTMFAGRKHGEMPNVAENEPLPAKASHLEPNTQPDHQDTQTGKSAQN